MEATSKITWVAVGVDQQLLHRPLLLVPVTGGSDPDILSEDEQVNCHFNITDLFILSDDNNFCL